MSNYLDCCRSAFRRNSTDLKSLFPTWFPYCTWPDSNPIFPFQRGDYGEDCGGIPGDPNYNSCHLGAWPMRGTLQTFETLGLMFGVTFTYSTTTITAHKTAHGLKRGGEAFRIYGQIGVNVVLNGSWTVDTIPDADSFTFTVSTAPTADLATATLDFRDMVNECLTRGFKAVQSGKAWNGRFGFITDYANHPETAETKYKNYAVTVHFSEQYASNYTCYNSLDGSFSSSNNSTGGNSGSATSTRSLTVGGLENCAGSTASGDGIAQCDDSTNGVQSCFNPGGTSCSTVNTPAGIQLTAPADDCLYPDSGAKAAARAANAATLKGWCAINADRGEVQVTIPVRGRYSGAAAGLAAWLVAPNNDTGEQVGCSTNSLGQTSQLKSRTITTFALVDFSFSETHFSGKATFEITYTNEGWTATDNFDGTCTPNIKFFDSVETYSCSFDFTIDISDPYTLAQADADAKTLLNEWDMTKDSILPWQTGACNIAPYVSRWEKSGVAPGYGYCDTPADPDSPYDGSVRGAPISSYNRTTGAHSTVPSANYPVGRYNEGWFDWDVTQYFFSDVGDGSYKTCYKFGQYVADALAGVSMATQFTPGATDASDRGGFWQPFSRYKYNYNLPLPPWVNYSGAYAATDGVMVYAAKWAEKKEPLPSQNCWGECGVMRLSADYPSAYGICGKMQVVSAVQSGGNVVITTAASCWLKNGDSLDFTGIAGLGSNVTVAGLSGSVAEVTSFTVAGTLTSAYVSGGYVQAHGAPDPVWYDLAPKGYFVRAIKSAGVHTAEEGNVAPAAGKSGIIAIVPEGSPEIDNPAWPGLSTVIYSDYGQSKIPAVGTSWDDAGWYSTITQGMADRFIINAASYVEARLHAPTGAPLQFTADNLPEWLKMPLPTDYGFQCSDAWDMTDSTLGFSLQHGVSTNTADALKTNTTADASDAGWGTADATFIP